MAEVRLTPDEWWPVWEEGHVVRGTLLEVPDDLLQRYREAKVAFEAVLEELTDFIGMDA